MSTLELGVLISGRGSNLQAILDAIADGRLDARVRLVVSNKPDAAGLARAEQAHVPTLVVDHRAFPTRTAFDAELVRALCEARVEWVVLAGFMRILTPTFLRAFACRVINIHPALLPAFPGVDAQQQALDYGVRITGCTVHLVDEGVDTGPILAQSALAILPDESRAALADRLLRHEHRLLVQALEWIAQGRLEIEPATTAGGRARVRLRGVVPAMGVERGLGAAPDVERGLDPAPDVERGRGAAPDVERL